MAWYDDPTIITIVIVLVVIVAITASMSVLFGMRLRDKKKTEPEQKPVKETKGNINLDFTTNTQYTANTPFRISKSVQTSQASNAKDELRILDLEREILGDSIRRLYEAQAEGKITEPERDRLASTYKNRMNTIKESIAKDETIVALHELEGMQEDLMTLFSERFGELTSKVDELRGRIDIKPIKEIPIKPPTPVPTQMDSEEEEEEEETSEGEDKPKKKPVQRKPPVEKPDVKSEAEKRIESIRSEVEKVLDKLGQMEIES
jgi:flagellar basal body-associated protein FliL